jgi:serine/threonine protein kinase
LKQVKLSIDLNHPGLVQTLSYGVSKETTGEKEVYVVWIVQELCTTGALVDACERCWFRLKRAMVSAPNMTVAVSTLGDIAAGMAYLHTKSIIHAHLTSRNVLLTSSGSPHGFCAKVCDFGLSRSFRRSLLPRTLSAPVRNVPSESLLPAASVMAPCVSVSWKMMLRTRTSRSASTSSSPTPRSPQLAMAVSRRLLTSPRSLPEKRT